MASIGSTFTATPALVGSKEYLHTETISTPGLSQDLIDETIGASLTWSVYSVNVDFRAEGRGYIYKNANIVGSFRTGPASPNAYYLFSLPLELQTGDNFKVTFITLSSSPAMDVAATVQYLEATA